MQRPAVSLLIFKFNPACVFQSWFFGATPIAVREEQQRWQNRLENEPVHFFEELMPIFLKTPERR